MVDLEESEKQVKGYMTRNKLSFNVFLDTEGTLSEKYAIVGVPTVVFVGKDGSVLDMDHGIPDEYEKIFNTKTQAIRHGNSRERLVENK